MNGGCELTNDPASDWDYAVHWNYNDTKIPPLELCSTDKRVFNINCTSTRKDYTDKVFEDIFGYSIDADTHKIGRCIKKSVHQSTHDGVIVETPCKKKKGFVYQKWIDNRINKEWIRDIRVPIFDGTIPMIFIKDRVSTSMFITWTGKRVYSLDPAEKHLTAREAAKILEFSKAVGLDLGELDVLRDNSTGLIYVIDVNDTPGGNVFKYIKGGWRLEKDLTRYMMSLL